MLVSCRRRRHHDAGGASDAHRPALAQRPGDGVGVVSGVPGVSVHGDGAAGRGRLRLREGLPGGAEAAARDDQDATGENQQIIPKIIVECMRGFCVLEIYTREK